jgi:hypothetical protein
MASLSDFPISMSDIESSMARYYRMRGTKDQFTRMGKTAKWFQPRDEIMRGETYEFYAFTQPSSPIRRENMSTAETGEFPVGHDYDYTELSVKWDDLVHFRGTVRWNELTKIKSKDRKHALHEVSTKLVNELELDFADSYNAALHQGGTCTMANVAGIYDTDGSSLTNEDGHAAKYINIDGGSISQFQPGMVLEIYDASTTTQRNCIVKVHDVIYGKDGPWSEGDRVADIGPGIIAEPCDKYGDLSTTAWNATDTPADGDAIARYGEYTSTASSYRNFHGLPDWFDTTTDVYRDSEGGSLLNRESAGNHWQNPEISDFTSGGSAVAIDLDTHFRDMEDTLPFRVQSGRKKRRSLNGPGIDIGSALTAITTVGIVNDAVGDVRDSVRFTSTMSGTMDAATKKELFGEIGFDGVCYHSPSLGSIAIQADPACTPERMYVIDPQSFFFLTNKDGTKKINWLDMDGKGNRWQRLTGGTERTPTHYWQGGAYCMMALVCDQPGANFCIKGVKSSNA